MKTLEEIKAILSVIEPDETMYSTLTEEDIPNLKQLKQVAEPWLAARVIFALSRIATNEAYDTIVEAATDQRKEVRVAVAASANVLPSTVSDVVLNSLLEDDDLGVKKFAIKAVSNSSDIQLKNKLNVLSNQGSNEFIRRVAKEKLLRINR